LNHRAHAQKQKRDRDAFEQARARKAQASQFAAPLPVKLADEVEAIRQLGNNFTNFIDELTARNRPIWEMQANLLKMLSEDLLEAWGVEVQPELGRAREQIPTFIFENRPKVNWSKNSIENVRRKFEAIEVRRSVVDRKLLAPTFTPSERGRPSKASEIEKAIRGLLAEGIDLRKSPRSQAYEQIRQFAVHKLNCNIAIGFSDPVIQRCLVKLLGKRA